MKYLLKLLAILFITVALSACNTVQEYWIDEVKPRISSTTYTVSQGDTLYSVAWVYDLDYRELAVWNNIKAPNYLIYPGQKLRLSAPKSAPPSPKAELRKKVNLSGWQWPLHNPDVKDILRSNAVLMKGKRAEIVHSVANGTVVYSGFSLKHYRGLIIIKHDNEVFSIYGYNQEILVTEKEHVSGGQEIARLSNKPGDANLYFEMKQGNQSLKVLNYLPNLKVSIH